MISILVLVIALAYGQVSHDSITLRVEPVRLAPTIKTVPSNIAFKASFPTIGYEIRGDIFETH
jgi:hypothetical protein